MSDQLNLLTSDLTHEEAIHNLVANNVAGFAANFSARHIGEVRNPDGVINMKIHNVFVAQLSQEVQYYSSLARSLDSSMGNMLEAMAIQIAMLSYHVSKDVQGPLSREQTEGIARLLERYNRLEKRPELAAAADYRVCLYCQDARQRRRDLGPG